MVWCHVPASKCKHNCVELIKMFSSRVDSSLLLGANDKKVNDSFLFYCAKHFSQQGKAVVFISPVPIESLPPIVNGRDNEDLTADYKKIRFWYPSDATELIESITSIYDQHNPATVYLLSQVEHYGDRASAICTAMLHSAFAVAEEIDCRAVVMAAHTLPAPNYLFCDLFSNIWSVSGDEFGEVRVENITREKKSSQPIAFHFSYNAKELILRRVLTRSDSTVYS